MKRLFLALPLTADAKAELAKVQDILKPSFERAKWVSSDGMHITLKFLGYVKYELLAEGLIIATRKVTEKYGTWLFSLNGLGAFPSNKRPRVVWAGVKDGGDSGRLAGLLDEALKPLGFQAENREFNPHITLARLKTQRVIENPEIFETVSGMIKKVEMTADTLLLYESVVKPTGAEYIVRQKFPLG